MSPYFQEGTDGMTKKSGFFLLICMISTLILVSCGKAKDANGQPDDVQISTSLTYDHSMELDYAKEFSVDYYDGGYALITISDESRFLFVPKKRPIPKDLSEDIVILKQPIDHIYLVASAVMDMFCSLDGLDSIRLSGTKEEGWYIEEAK